MWIKFKRYINYKFTTAPITIDDIRSWYQQQEKRIFYIKINGNISSNVLALVFYKIDL